MKKIFIVALVCLITTKNNAQNKQADSLKKLLAKTTNLRERYELLSMIGKGYYSYGTGENTVANDLELKDDSLIAKSYNDVGDLILFEQGDFNTATNYLFKGIPYAEKANNKRWLSSLYIDIALCYWYLQDASEQFNYLKKAEASLPLPNEPEHDYMSLQLKTGYALYYLLINQPKTALPYINESEDINSKLNYPVFNLYTKILYGYVYASSGDKELSDIYFNKAMKLDSIIKLPFVKYFSKYTLFIYTILF